MESSTTTTYRVTSKTYETDSPSSTAYRASIAPRSVIIQRTSYGGLGSASPGGGMSLSRERSVQYGASPAVAAGTYALVSNAGVTAVKSSREREKKDMQDLNERFASYIEKVRFLEAQNRKLADELDKLKAKWGKETTQIKAMYQAELDEARKLLDDAVKEKARLEIRVASLEEQLEEMRQKLEEARRAVAESKDKIDRQNQQLSDYEAEVGLLRRRVDQLETDRDKDKKLIAQLQESINRTRADLDNETLLHIDAENRRQTLEEELEFIKSVHEQEMKELAALAYRDTTAENREFWKNEMGQALREIQQIYDDKMDAMRGELEGYYNLKVQEFRTGATRQNMESTHLKEETKRLRTQMGDLRDKLAELDARNQQLQRELDALRREKEQRERELEDENNELKGDVAKLRAEMEAILKELQDIMDTKLGLELEIAAYRKLLEGEESRVGLRTLIGSWAVDGGNAAGGGGGSGGSSAGGSGGMALFGGSGGGGAATSAGSSISMIKGEMSAKTTYQRSAKGPVSIPECAPDGKYITIENTGRKDEVIGQWTIKRNIDGKDNTDFVFEPDFTIKPGTKVKVWAKGSKPENAPEGDIEGNDATWGVGANITTKLTNPGGEDRATHIQKTTYS
jgi:intermediate filament protein if